MRNSAACCGVVHSCKCWGIILKVLVIDEWLPWPLESGKKIRTYNLLSRLARMHEISIIAYVDLPQEKSKITHFMEMGINVVTVKDNRIKKWTFLFYLTVCLNFFSTKPYSTFYHIKKSFSVKLKETIELIKPEIIHCEWTNLAPFLTDVKDIPFVLVAHNVESDIWKRLSKNSYNYFSRIVGQFQAKKIEKLERCWYPKVNHCIAVSDEDREVIAGYGANVTVVENGVDITYYNHNLNNSSDDQNFIAFTASFDTFSNQDGAFYFIKEILPIIKKRIPSISIGLVGKNPPEKLKNISNIYPEVVVTGTIPDVRAILSKSKIAVVPLRIGGGSRLKILEAMAMKKPVVSTSIGAEGLNVQNRENILIADTANDFAEAVIECLQDQLLREKVSEAGYALVKSVYNWDILAKKQSDIWTNLQNL
jgi:glycosyltransferase involved in cell wall biosynthesis